MLSLSLYIYIMIMIIIIFVFLLITYNVFTIFNKPPSCCWCDVTKHVWYLLWADFAPYQLPGSVNWVFIRIFSSGVGGLDSKF
jgi:hypothetical protein